MINMKTHNHWNSLNMNILNYVKTLERRGVCMRESMKQILKQNIILVTMVNWQIWSSYLFANQIINQLITFSPSSLKNFMTYEIVQKCYEYNGCGTLLNQPRDDNLKDFDTQRFKRHREKDLCDEKKKLMKTKK